MDCVRGGVTILGGVGMPRQQETAAEVRQGRSRTDDTTIESKTLLLTYKS